MFRTNLRRTIVTIAATAGLLAAAVPATAGAHPARQQAMLDDEGMPVVTDGVSGWSLGRDNTIEALRTPQSYSWGQGWPAA